MTDNRSVSGNPPDPHRMQTGQAKEGSGTTPLVVGTWTSKTHLGKTSDGSCGLPLLLLYGDEYDWWV
jgi:hypothetical protein